MSTQQQKRKSPKIKHLAQRKAADRQVQKMNAAFERAAKQSCEEIWATASSGVAFFTEK